MGAFLLGCAFAGMMGGSTRVVETTRRMSSADELYLNEAAIKRVIDPLKVTLSCTGGRSFFNDESKMPKFGTLAGLFQYVVGESHVDEYEVLRITKVLSMSSSSVAFFWFEYVRKENLKSIDPDIPASP
jgi:hypothetical protein